MYATGMHISGGQPSYSDPRILLAPNGTALDDAQMDRPGNCGYTGDPDRHLRCIAGGNRGFRTSRNRHPGGVQVALLDGSVRLVSESIQSQMRLYSLSMQGGECVPGSTDQATIRRVRVGNRDSCG